MTAHELAAILLSVPDLPVVAHANNHTSSASDRVRVGRLNRDRIIVGNFLRDDINAPNDVVQTEYKAA
jgi:hypothetical protein